MIENNEYARICSDCKSQLTSCDGQEVGPLQEKLHSYIENAYIG